MKILYLISLFLCVISNPYLFEDDPKIKEIKTREELDLIINSKTPSIVLFYANWCPHCHAFSPIFKDLAEAYSESKSDLVYNAVDCASHSDICKVVTFKTYPTLWTWNVDRATEKEGMKIVLESRSYSTIVDWFSKRGYPLQQNLEFASTLDVGFSDFNVVTLMPQKSRWKQKDIPAEERVHDALVTVQYILGKLVFVANGNDFSYESIKDLVYVIKILSLSFPVKNVRERLREILHGFMEVIRRNEEAKQLVPAGHWTKVIQNVQFSKSIPAVNVNNLTTNFKNCEQFTCGLWTLFHLMQSCTLQKYEDGTVAATPAQTQYLVRTIVSRFFLCHACRLHFLRIFDKEIFDRTKHLIEFSLNNITENNNNAIVTGNTDLQKLTYSREKMEALFNFPTKKVRLFYGTDRDTSFKTAPTVAHPNESAPVTFLNNPLTNYNNILNCISSVDELLENYLVFTSSSVIGNFLLWRPNNILENNRQGQKTRSMSRERSYTEYWLWNAHNTVSNRIASTPRHPINMLSKEEEKRIELQPNDIFIRYLNMDVRWPNMCIDCNRANRFTGIAHTGDINTITQPSVVVPSNQEVNFFPSEVYEETDIVAAPLRGSRGSDASKSRFVITKELVSYNLKKKDGLFFVQMDDDGGSLENDIKFSYTQDFIPLNVRKYIRNSYWKPNFEKLIEI